jgi:hypothetical protein
MMKNIRTNSRITESHTQQNAVTSRLKGMALAAVALFTVAFTAPGAYAGCGQIEGIKGGAIKMPMLSGAGSRMADLGDGAPGQDSAQPIVGLWHVVYTAGNAIFGVSLKEWHSDGTEFENIAHSPAIGNICFGVWKPVASHTVRLHHTGWLFSEQGELTGSFTNDETDIVDEDGMTYKGSFVFKTYDTNGKLTGVEVSGTIAAQRITVS